MERNKEEFNLDAPATRQENGGIRIVFMGTPEFAVASLEALVSKGYDVAGVVTAPDKPAGRGMKLGESPVKRYAVEKGLAVLQPLKLKEARFLEELSALKADLGIVVAFRMLPEIVWSMPPLGTVNVHGSLLPQYRGAAPINWAIINGERETGVTTFKLKHEIDTGNILLQEKISIGEHETAGELHDRMKDIGADLLIKTVQELAGGSLIETAQAGAEKEQVMHHAPKISTDTCRINWNKPAGEVRCLIRGLSPYPAAFTQLGGKTLKVLRGEEEIRAVSDAPGTVQTDKKTYLKFACSNGYLLVKELQLEGKKRMPVEEFLRGYRFE